MVEVEIQTKLLAAGVLSVKEVRSMRGLAPAELANPLVEPQNV
jgi:hypothetical protein